MSQPDASHRPRRDLFQPAALGAAVAAAADVVADLRQALTSPESAEPEPDASPLLRFSRSAMATLFEVLLPLGTPRAHAAAQSALDVIDAVEDELSIYRPTSALSDLNRRACAEAVTVSPGLFAFLEQAARLHEQTGGAFDLAAGALVAAWGFFRGPARWPDAAELSAARQASGMQHVELDPATCRVRFRRPGIVLNPGSIGKGWALDAAAQALARQGCSSALLQGGCSSVLALGTPPGSPTGWCVGLADPRVPVRRQARLWLKDQALATSAATFKQASVGGRAINHILNPRIGQIGRAHV